MALIVIVVIGCLLFILSAYFRFWCFYQIVTLGWLVAHEPDATILALEYIGAILVLAYSVFFACFLIGYIWERR